MSLVTQMIVAEKYGLRLRDDQVAQEFGAAAVAEIPCYVDFGRRFFDFRDVAAYLDNVLARVRATLASGAAILFGIPIHETSRKVRRAPWADLAAIKAIYLQCRAISKATGVHHHVDHIIPKLGRLVCGLHVETNLRIITASENCRKHNRFEVT